MLTSKHSISAAKPLLERYFWPLLALIWLAATGLDRLWLHLDQRLPAWDQADYLNSALDHGRALGLLAGGSWQGWQALLDLSPKIPPLASLVNGSVIAIAGDAPDQAAWALSLWFGLLLLAVALWGKQLGGEALGLVAALLCCLMPLLAELRVDFVLEIPVCASCTWALWLLGRWLQPQLKTAGWWQALQATLAVSAALLIKQSALLVLLPALVWASVSALRQGQGKRLQLLAAMALVLALLLPWLQHNLVTTLGGTERATLESAAREGDPNASTLAGWLWYPKRLPALVGELPLFGGIAGLLIAIWRRPKTNKAWHLPNQQWRWLLGSMAAGALLTVLSPNKDPRYLAPLLPLLALVLARGWLALPLPLLGLGFVVAGGLTASTRARAIERQGTPPEPLEAIVRYLQAQKPMAARTLIVVPSTGSLNQHNVSYYGRRSGGQLVGRQLGNNPAQIPAALASAEQLLLGTGFQGSVGAEAQVFSDSIRNSGLFKLEQSWPKPLGGTFELWQRKPTAPKAIGFADQFPLLAAGLAKGPKGLAPLFDAIGVQHQLDGHRSYQKKVRQQALTELRRDPNNAKALWSLALLCVLQNRALEAEQWFARLEQLEPQNPWPAAYRAVVLNAAWQPWRARAVADAGQKRSANPVLEGLADLSGALAGEIWRLGELQKSLPKAVQAVDKQLAN